MANSSRTVFISGANRGLGFSLACSLARRGDHVVAGYRDEERSRALIEEAERQENLSAFQVDVTHEADLKALYELLEGRFGFLDILVNNAGIKIDRPGGFNDLDWHAFEETFRVNVGGPFLATKHLYPLVSGSREKKIVNITSQMGSIQRSGGDSTPYRVSKTALNMLTRNQSIAYRKDGVTVVGLHPGWVRTDMGGPGATLSVEEAVSELVRAIDSVSLEETGEFLSTRGDRIPY